MNSDRTRRAQKQRVSLLPRRAEGTANIEDRLSRILKDLARILVSNGYGIAGLNRLVKRAYFEAALELDLAAGRRASYARIAAITGLTRVEVSQLSQPRIRTTNSKTLLPANRAQRVSWAWISDSNYCDKKGVPNVLPLNGKKGSFERLVKSYSGDIPARAMFLEMSRIGMVREVPGRAVRLVRADIPISRQTAKSLRALSPWMSFLAQGETNGLSELNASAIQVALNFDSLPQLFSAVRELQKRATAFIDSAHELSGKRGRARQFKLDISFAFGTRVSNPDGNSLLKDGE